MCSTEKKIKIISLGWGVQSWTLAAMVALGELPMVDAVVHSDTGWEREGTYTFAAKWSGWLEGRGVTVVSLPPVVRHSRVVSDGNAVSIPAYTTGNGVNGQLRRQCTGDWKIAPIRRYVTEELRRRGAKRSAGAVEMWLGITLDEWMRAKQSSVKYIVHRYPLLERRMSRADCVAWLKNNQLPVPPKSSCTFCPYHSDAAWAQMKREGGADWEQALMVDESIRGMRPPYDLYLHRACKPLADAVVIPEDFGACQGTFLDKDAIPCDSGFCFL